MHEGPNICGSYASAGGCVAGRQGIDPGCPRSASSPTDKPCSTRPLSARRPAHPHPHRRCLRPTYPPPRRSPRTPDRRLPRGMRSNLVPSQSLSTSSHTDSAAPGCTSASASSQSWPAVSAYPSPSASDGKWLPAVSPVSAGIRPPASLSRDPRRRQREAGGGSSLVSNPPAVAYYLSPERVLPPLSPSGRRWRVRAPDEGGSTAQSASRKRPLAPPHPALRAPLPRGEGEDEHDCIQPME